MNQDDVVFVRRERLERPAHRLLPGIASLNHLYPSGQRMFGNQCLHAADLRFTHGDINRGHPGHRGECAQAVHQNGKTLQSKKLLGGIGSGVTRCHACAQAGGR